MRGFLKRHSYTLFLATGLVLVAWWTLNGLWRTYSTQPHLNGKPEFWSSDFENYVASNVGPEASVLFLGGLLVTLLMMAGARETVAEKKEEKDEAGPEAMG